MKKKKILFSQVQPPKWKPRSFIVNINKNEQRGKASTVVCTSTSARVSKDHGALQDNKKNYNYNYNLYYKMC